MMATYTDSTTVAHISSSTASCINALGPSILLVHVLYNTLVAPGLRPCMGHRGIGVPGVVACRVHPLMKLLDRGPQGFFLGGEYQRIACIWFVIEAEHRSIAHITFPYPLQSAS